MKRIFPVLLIAVIVSYFSSCEKDDICVEGDTPFLVIGFYDAASEEEEDVFKSVPSLRIRAIDNDSIYSKTTAPVFTDRSTVSDSVLVPLRIDASTTTFEFIINSDDNDEDIETGTIDSLTFSYSVDSEYISRACGFIPNFNALDTTRQVYTTDWIKRISIVNENVERSNTIHVKIFH
ncbi:DUF6452 family protein [Croceitalea rosinachiae]|uniref:DUF6452 family protein n=1 Tax=Croceitalea rosinachiae TaxID=3075596 RepID=A0ABU3AEH1_9FLAO|nr:DUF6452 family protein [Croceitalea sp. F388]MDT0608586.1 DUF6452 family protein [Croceitalea sp. F388]